MRISLWLGRLDLLLAGKQRVSLFPIACTIVAVALSCAGVNGSSSALVPWVVDGVAPSSGLIAGEAKLIRSDEWMVHTPWLFSQARQVRPFSSRNPSVGGEHAPLVCNLPVTHWSMLFRPELWVFLTGLNFESAFAIFWNFKWWSLLCGSYCLLLLITRGEALLSAAGALILFWSSIIQWLFSSPTLMPDMIGLWSFALAAGVGAVVHPSHRARIPLALAYTYCLLGFLFCCYPPFQIPLLTLFVPLLIVLVREQNGKRSWIPLVAATAVVIAAEGVFAWQVRGTLSTIGELDYPGRRFSTGGGAPWTSLVQGFLTLGASQLHFPKNFANVVAASSFLDALPLLICIHLVHWWRNRTRDAVQALLLVFAIFAALFSWSGFPHWLATISFWSYTTPERLTVVLALVNALALCRFLSVGAAGVSVWANRWTAFAGALIFGLVLIAANRNLHSFAHNVFLSAIWLFYSIAGFLLVARFRVAFLAMILGPLVFWNAGINPVNRSLPGYSTTSISQVVADLHRSFPRTHWIVLGPFIRGTVVSALLKTTGATVFSGITAVPNQEMLAGLDPKHQHASVYSRYAAVCFLPGTNSEGVPEFELEETTIYSVRLPVTDQWLGRAGIDGVVVPDDLDPPMPQHFREVASVSGFKFWIRIASVGNQVEKSVERSFPARDLDLTPDPLSLVAYKQE